MAVAPQELITGRGQKSGDISKSHSPAVPTSVIKAPEAKPSLTPQSVYVQRPLYPIGDPPPEPGPMPRFGIETAEDWELWVGRTEARNDYFLKKSRAETFAKENDLRGTF